MVQPVNKLLSYQFGPEQANEKHRINLTQHLSYLRDHKDTRTVTITEAESRPYYYNLYKFLSAAGYPDDMHWIIMRVNGMNSPEEFDNSVKTLRIPSIQIVDDIINMAKG